MRRLLRTPMLLAGLGLWVAFLGVLVVVFVKEDATRLEEAANQRAALEAFATVSFRRALDDEWRLGMAMMESAVADPLVDDSRLLLSTPGETQRLPRRAWAKQSHVVAAMNELLRGPSSQDQDDSEDPARDRRRLVYGLKGALESAHRDEVVRLVRAHLDHRRLYRINIQDELAALLATVELLQTKSTPSSELLQRVLRDGFGPTELGLQRVVLGSADRLTPEDLLETCSIIERQSRRAQVPTDDFLRRCEQVAHAEPVSSDEALDTLTLRTIGARVWVVRGGRELRGTLVSMSALEEALHTLMRERGLLIVKDEFVLTAANGPVEQFSVRIESARWERAAASRRAALLTKLALVALAFVLGLGLVGLSFVVQRGERALVEAKSQLISTVSHELRTPLASLRVMAETLERKVEGISQAKDWPRRIVSEVDGLSALVENILAFNRIEQGRDVFQVRRWNLSDLRAWLESEAGPLIRVSVEGVDGLAVDADPTWMKVAFLNLLRNATKYNERTPAEFSVSAQHDGQTIRIEIRDNGIGIPPAHWDDVFEAFYRLRDARGRGTGGSGLGLALVKRVVEGHRGSIRVAESTPEGTTFSLTLPVDSAASKKSGSAQARW